MPNSRKSRCLGDLNDHERLQDRLEWEGFSETKIKSDGNCQFRALADQLFKTVDSHGRVRREVVKQLKSRPQSYKGFVGAINFSEYVKNMSNNAVWGDNLTLQAAADLYGVEIVVITSYKDKPKIEVCPKSQKHPDKVIYLSFLAEYHYNSIYLNNTGSSGSGSGSSGSGSGSETDTASMELQGKNKNNKESNKENVKEKKKKKKNKKKKNKNKEEDL